MKTENSQNIVPKNVGIIMDGNGRWGLEHNNSRKYGHTQGMINLIDICSHAFDLNVKTVTCYCLSLDNLNRAKEEVNHILSLVIDYFEPFIEAFRKRRVCAKFIGSLDRLPLEIVSSLKKTESELAEFSNEGRTIYIAIAYGSQQEIVSAVNRAVKEGKEVSTDSFLNMLQQPLLLDLLIRTGGEYRLSDFLLYQSSYAEIYFSDKLFPDFSVEDFDKVLDWYANRDRRFGLLKDKV